MPTSDVLARRSRVATLVIVSLGLFMVVLDNLVVNVALASIHRDFGASVQSLEWIVNAYVLAYAVLLLTGSVLGDRFGRKRMFITGIALFTLASAGSALATTTSLLIATRALQGVGAAIVTPLTLTLLADAFPPERRGIALGVWSGISGTAVALGPLVGGAMIQIANWHWIFWINVPVGLVLAPVAARMLHESRGSERGLDLAGLGLSSSGLFGVVFGLIRSQTLGWTAPEVLVSLIAGALLLVGFIAQELRTDDPMLPMGFFRRRSFAVTNMVSLSMYFGMFGSVFFMSQYLQNVLGNTPFEAGLKLLVWTGSTMLVAPAAGYFSERIGSRVFMIAGLALQAVALGWLAMEASVGQSYASMIVPFVLAGSGMALVFAPSANAVLASVRTDQAGQASGATNAIRELGGVLGISVLSTVFTSNGSYASGLAYVHGLTPAMWVGTAVLAGGALIAAALPFDTREQSRAIQASAAVTA
ncbi:MAG TPA: DHA2 family efflux MFS transporter permease subunit [Solirubrobacteraceae bacterium]|nr:DHA2 family efflux MFS transporter permease subunit [Solirubrobacteraceae bacterium]